MALQKGGATAINAIMFTTQTAVSSLIGVAYLDDRVRTGFGTTAIVGFALAITGAIAAAHYASLAHPKTGQQHTGTRAHRQLTRGPRAPPPHLRRPRHRSALAEGTTIFGIAGSVRSSGDADIPRGVKSDA
jgi:hypothetical protein